VYHEPESGEEIDFQASLGQSGFSPFNANQRFART
jgi:hypothetical protein